MSYDFLCSVAVKAMCWEFLYLVKLMGIQVSLKPHPANFLHALNLLSLWVVSLKSVGLIFCCKVSAVDLKCYQSEWYCFTPTLYSGKRLHNVQGNEDWALWGYSCMCISVNRSQPYTSWEEELPCEYHTTTGVLNFIPSSAIDSLYVLDKATEILSFPVCQMGTVM